MRAWVFGDNVDTDVLAPGRTAAANDGSIVSRQCFAISSSGSFM